MADAPQICLTQPDMDRLLHLIEADPGKRFDKLESKGGPSIREGLIESEEMLLGNQAQGDPDNGRRHCIFSKTKDLIEKRFGVA